MFSLLCVLCFLSAVLPALLFLRNLVLYASPPEASTKEPISILIPARNEERSIGGCVEAALLSCGADVEVIVLDDHSEDGTARVVEEIASRDPRVRLMGAPPLPAGWCGKQFACFVLAALATRPLLCFIDADVELAPDGVARMAGALRGSGAGLISGFPRQITVTPLEQLLLPLMHFLLLGFLPIDRMRQSVHPWYGAGCGQIFMADQGAYWRAGGHDSIRRSRHDGLMLPRAFREAGLKTDLCDATVVASCRMYRNGHEVITGLLKNASEGLAARRRIVPFSLLLVLGQVVPFLLLAGFGRERMRGYELAVVAVAAASALLPRIIAAFRFRQPVWGAVFHPLAIVVLLAIQWVALLREFLRVPGSWKGRRYSTP